MKRKGVLMLILVVVIAALSGTLSACSKGDEPSPSTQAIQPSSTATTTITAGSSSQTSNTVSATTSIAKPCGIPDIADIKTLPSYRLSILTRMVEGSDAPAGSVTNMKYEYIRDQKAEHAWMEDSNGKVTEVYITIGDKRWIWMGAAGMGWMEQPYQAATSTSLPSDLASQLKQAQQDVNKSKVRFDQKGTETVNGVRCMRYEAEYSLTTDMPNFATGGTTKTDSHSTGETWLSDQNGLPTVVIKSKSRTEITAAGQKTVMDSEQNVTDIGAAITINPPSGAIQPPTGMPTAPSTQTTTPETTFEPTTPMTTSTIPPNTPISTSPTTLSPTTTATTGGLPIFNDDFKDIWNSEWVWTDPNDDATYSLTAHPGFLQVSVPGENDLAGVANYDAPRLLIQRNGNFALETLVEFDPQEYYQGAGLLVWQDEDTFLRLEFGFGGMGGDAKNVVFVEQREGGLGLVNGIDLPDTANKIELRLERSANQFTALYRWVGGTWQTIGSTELIMNQTIDAGIAQVTQYTSSEVSADFDYFKVFAP
jgi:regulation of enolase protein 1 (concanavalin A-like superfamily)